MKIGGSGARERCRKSAEDLPAERIFSWSAGVLSQSTSACRSLEAMARLAQTLRCSLPCFTSFLSLLPRCFSRASKQARPKLYCISIFCFWTSFSGQASPRTACAERWLQLRWPKGRRLLRYRPTSSISSSSSLSVSTRELAFFNFLREGFRGWLAMACPGWLLSAL